LSSLAGGVNWVLGPENTRKPIDEFETINYSSQATKIGHREKIIIIIIFLSPPAQSRRQKN